MTTNTERKPVDRHARYGWTFRYADGSRYGTYSAAEAARLIEAQTRMESPAVRIVKFSEARSGKRAVVEVIAGGSA